MSTTAITAATQSACHGQTASSQLLKAAERFIRLHDQNRIVIQVAEPDFESAAKALADLEWAALAARAAADLEEQAVAQ